MDCTAGMAEPGVSGRSCTPTCAQSPSIPLRTPSMAEWANAGPARLPLRPPCQRKWDADGAVPDDQGQHEERERHYVGDGEVPQTPEHGDEDGGLPTSALPGLVDV